LNIDYSLINLENLIRGPLPICSMSWNSLYNLDGFINYHPTESGKVSSYVQLFRNGNIEAVKVEGSSSEEGLVLSTQRIKDILVGSIGVYSYLMKSIGISVPLVIFVTTGGQRIF